MTTDPVAFERIVTIAPAFDKRSSDPKKNYGIHGCELRMVLKGPLGATQFLLFTNWHLPHVQAELDRKEGPARNPHLFCHPLPADKGYHWSTKQYESQEPMKCDLLPGGQCYYDGSGLNADDVYKTLLAEGSDGVWRVLEEYYHYMATRKEEPA